MTDKRQEFLLEDILETLTMDRLVEHTCIINELVTGDDLLVLIDLDSRSVGIPVPLKHILPQKVSTPSLATTLRMMDSLPIGAEVSVRESTNEKTVEFIPGLQNIRKMTLPQMYFESCSIFRGMYGRVKPLFSHPEDAAMIPWKPGAYGKVYCMFMSQLYPHCKEFHVHDWRMIAHPTETTGGRGKLRTETRASQPKCGQVVALQIKMSMCHVCTMSD